MTRFAVSLAKRHVAIDCPPSLAANIQALFGTVRRPPTKLVGAITVSDDGAARFSIESRHSEPVGNLTLPELLSRLLDEVGRSLIFDLDSAVALHGASVLANDNKIVLI